MTKLRITLKGPDSVSQSLKDAGIDEDNIENTEFGEVFDRFVKYAEYVTIELDSETGEATVVPVNE